MVHIKDNCFCTINNQELQANTIYILIHNYKFMARKKVFEFQFNCHLYLLDI